MPTVVGSSYQPAQTMRTSKHEGGYDVLTLFFLELLNDLQSCVYRRST